MKRKPLHPITMAQVFASLASMKEDTFRRFRAEVTSADAFDSDKERVEPLALRLNLDVDTVSLIMNLLSFLYEEIHDDDVDSISLTDAIKEVIFTARKSDSSDSYLTDIDEPQLTNRLSYLLEKNDNIKLFNKSRRVRSGFSPVATDFKSFIDLRPVLSEDRQQIAQIIPIVQFMITSETAQPFAKNYVFQMDRRRLKALKDAVDAAIQKLDVITSTESISDLIKQR